MSTHDAIDKLKMDVVIPDVVQNKVDITLDKIRGMKGEEYAEAKILPYSTKQSRTVSKFPRKRIAAIAAIATLTIATVTVAAAYLNWSKSLSEGLQVPEEKKVQMEESRMSAFVEQTCTDQGITVTAVQSITDNYYTHIAFRVEGYQVEDGVQPDFETLKVTVGGDEEVNAIGNFYNGLVSDASGSIVNADGTPLERDEEGGFLEVYTMDDGSMEYQITLSNPHEKGYFINKPIHVEMNNLGTVSKAEYLNDIEGTWSFDWELQGSEEMKEYTLNAPLGDTGATVVRAEITPISLLVEYEVPREVDLNQMDMPGVKMKDGTLYPFLYLGPGSMGYQSDDSDLYVAAFPIDRIIDADQVEGLVFIKSYPEDEEPLTEEHLYIVPVE